MQSGMRLGRVRPLILLFVPLLCAACVGAPPIVTSPNACSALIPDSWHKPVPGADLPAGNTVGDWVAFGDAQTGQLDKANGRTIDTLDIIGRCEKREVRAIEKARSKFLGIF